MPKQQIKIKLTAGVFLDNATRGAGDEMTVPFDRALLLVEQGTATIIEPGVATPTPAAAREQRLAYQQATVDEQQLWGYDPALNEWRGGVAA